VTEQPERDRKTTRTSAPRELPDSLRLEAERIAERDAPAYVITDPQHEVLQFFGRTGSYLQAGSGAADLNLLTLVHPDLRADLRVGLQKAGRERQPVRLHGLQYGGGGDAGVVTVVVEPIRGGDADGYLVTFHEGGAAPSEQAIHKSVALCRLILDSAVDYAIISMDLEGNVTGWNPGARALLGWDESEMVGRSADLIFTPEDRAAGSPDIERRTADVTGRASDERWHMRRDGTRFWGSGSLTPMRNGPLSGYLKIMRDATAVRQAEDRQRLLLAELQHRVRNILAVVRSLSARSVETSGSLEDFASHFDGRLGALARTQSIFARTGEVAVDLDELVRDELVSIGAGSSKQVKVSGPPVQLGQHAGETLALALHELATNAVKYGALARPAGKISVSWRAFTTSAGPRLSLEWRESGVPAIEAEPERMGFGRELIERGLPYELGAATSLAFEPGGVRAVIELPLNEGIATRRPSEARP
jgi:PAS domain S-box-containing protein